VLPIIHGVDNFPLSAATKLRGRDLSEVEVMATDLIGPRCIRSRAGRSVPDIRVSHIAVGFGHLFGVGHKLPIDVTSPPINVYQVMVPLHGQLVRTPDIVAAPGSALIYAPQDCLNTYWSEDCVALVLSISAEKLGAVARAMLPHLDLADMPIAPWMTLTEGSGRSFANALAAICQESMDPNSAFSRGVTTRSLEETLLLSLLLAQQRFAQPLPGETLRRKPKSYVARALDYIDAHHADDITLADLTGITGVSARTLQYGFMEQFGVGPISYLKRLRLRSIHDTLRKAQPGACSVGDIAARWGFYNGSNFSRLYRKTFGELPSETLGRR
jgi:AraC-like DNA-binding protein